VQPIKVDIWSDIACPWCFIGKRRFEAGLALFAAELPNPAVDVEYHSFELAPDTPVDFDGSELAFLVQHKGIPSAEARMTLARVTAIAAGDGLRYDFAALKHTNSVLAHQLLHFAKAAGRQSAALDRLYQAYFEEGRHVGRVDDLADLAGEVGLDPAAARKALSSAEFLAAVRDDQRQAAALRIRGVPHYLFDGSIELTGAQDGAIFLQALTAAANRQPEPQPKWVPDTRTAPS
jgi:predicted DsbA family dithiol-disulfide isomerase